MSANTNGDSHNEEHFVEVTVATTSGFYPEAGSEKVPTHQPIKVQLEKAKDALNIADTSNWVVSVNKVRVDPNSSYAHNGLTGSIELDWGPDHGGGGSK